VSVAEREAEELGPHARGPDDRVRVRASDLRMESKGDSRVKEESPMIANGVSRQILVFSASALFASGSAFACSGPTCPCESLQQALAAISLIEAQAVDTPADYSRLQMLGDQEFMREALEDSAAKVLLGQLALQKSQSEDLRQFGQKLIQDQTELSEQVLQRVGKPLGVQEQKELSKKDKQLAARLVVLSGSQFDEEYIKALLKDQKQQLKRFGAETQLALDPGVKIAAEYGKKLISQHLESIERIAEGRSLVAENQKITGEVK
jgi:putative membrane protein